MRRAPALCRDRAPGHAGGGAARSATFSRNESGGGRAPACGPPPISAGRDWSKLAAVSSCPDVMPRRGDELGARRREMAKYGPLCGSLWRFRSLLAVRGGVEVFSTYKP